jgi:hypothetical protein
MTVQKKNKRASTLFPLQAEPFNDETRHHFILAGRRGGKTWLVRERLLKEISKCPEGGEVFYIGPTMQDAYDIMWEQLENRVYELGWWNVAHKSKRCFYFSRGRKLYIIGAEKIRRIRGHKVFFVAMDEVAFYSQPVPEIWNAVRPALSDLRGRALVTTTPKGKGTSAYDFYLSIKNKKTWRYFSWFTRDNPAIPKDEVELARLEMDERSFREEYEASWESFDGLAYYAYEEKNVVKPCQTIDREYPIDILLDFNVNPTTLLVAQYDFRKARIRKEYALRNSSTQETVIKFCQDHMSLRGTSLIRVFGDASGNSRRSTTGYSDYHYVKEALKENGFRFEICVPGVNPPIVNRVTILNAWLKNGKGECFIEVDPSCEYTIKDFSSQEAKGRIPLPNNNLGHRVDAAGYYIWWIQLLSTRKPQGSIQL